ncbi:MAG: type II/IV secretion system ATPase subunit [Candidatus Heimdallarchaeota archaeon]
MKEFSSTHTEIIEKKRTLVTYKIDGYLIEIYQDNNTIFYSTKPLYNFNQDPLLFAELSSLIYKNKDRLGKGILKFDELIDALKSICMWKILEMEDLPINADIFASLFIHRLIKLDKLIPLFLDDSINEIYMDQMYSSIYIDHQQFGRCNTNIFLEDEEVKSLLTRIKLEHPISISTKNPSLKVEFKTNAFHMRISMDFPPISPKGPTFNIRKLKRKPLRLINLIKLKTLTTLVAAYLVEAINERRNITIIGEPSAGKTTLANAIDLYTPKYWRKVAIEDAIESINQSNIGYKQLSIQVDSFESNKSIHTKTTEILKLLHRSPDWIYLGEIQSREHTQAMFEALNAGLKGIQTAHADSVDKIFRRWKNLHNISDSDFLSLDIIVVMKRELSEKAFIRKITEIYEIDTEAKMNLKNNGYLTNIYDDKISEENIMKNIQTKSFLKHKIEAIKKRNTVFMQELRNGK